MDSVRAADHDGLPMFQRARLQRVQQVVDVRKNEIHRFRHLDGQRGINDIRGGQPFMEKAASRVRRTWQAIPRMQSRRA